MKLSHPLARLPGLVLLLLLTSPIIGLCQTSPWESIGPEGGTITAVVQDRFNGKILYAATNGYPAKIFKTTDSGEHWAYLSTVSGYVVELIIPRTAPGTLVANGQNYIHRSTNAGTSWSTFSIPTSPNYYYATDIAVDPVNAQIIHAAAEGWTGSRSAPPGVGDGGAVIVDHLHPSLKGYQLIGKIYFETIQKNNLLPKAERI